MTLALESINLIEHFQYLQRSYDGAMPIRKAVLTSECQSDGTCVVNAETFVGPANFIWLNRDLLYENAKVRSSDITPLIAHPLSAGLYMPCTRYVRKFRSTT